MAEIPPFDNARQEYVDRLELRGGEIPLPDAVTPEQLANHVCAVVSAFWGWPGNDYSNAELVYRVALGALRRMRELSAQPAKLTPDEVAQLRHHISDHRATCAHSCNLIERLLAVPAVKLDAVESVEALRLNRLMYDDDGEPLPGVGGE